MYSWLYLCLHYKVSWCQTSLMGWLRSNFPLARSRKKGGHGVPQCHLAPDVIAEFGGGSWVAFLFPSGSGRRGSPLLRELQMVRSQHWRICLQSQETCWSKETIGVRRHAVSGSWDRVCILHMFARFSQWAIWFDPWSSLQYGRAGNRQLGGVHHSGKVDSRQDCRFDIAVLYCVGVMIMIIYYVYCF